MKKLYFILIIVIGLGANAQVFWTEDFGTNPVCAVTHATAYSGSNGAWTASLTGVNQSLSNIWYVSTKEAGTGVGNCGDDCTTNPILTNRSLHVSTHPSLLGDIGAAYSANTSLSNSNVRAESPIINCTGQSSIVMSFTYFVVGVINQDFCEVMYSSNGGSTWSGLGIAPQTTLGTCSPQGKWTTHTVSLPAACNNNNNVKIGFRWQNISGTGGDPCMAIDAISLSASTPPSLTVTYSMQTSICRGDSIQVTAVSSPSASTGHTWTSNPAGPLFSAPNASVTWIKFPTTNTFSITVTASSGTQIATHTKTILVNPTPTVNATAIPSVICNGNTATLNATSSGPILTYSWAPISVSGSSAVVSPTTTTTYQVWGTNTVTGCKGTAFRTVTVNPSPVIGASSNTANVCVGSTAVLTATGAVSYTWSPGSATGSSVVVSPTVNTTYTVTGTSSLGCTGTKTVAVTVSTCTGLQELASGQLPFSIYPNPVKDKITIKAGDVNMNSVKIEMFDVAGKKVVEHIIDSLPAGAEQNILVSDLSKGIYIMEVRVNGISQKAVRLVKE